VCDIAVRSTRCLSLFAALANRRFPEILFAIPMSDVFSQLMAVIEDRKAKRPAGSYTTQLFEGGVERIGAKVLEEAREVVEAAAEPSDEGRSHLIYEAGDVLFHLFVLLSHRDVRLDEVEAELARRFGVSGLEEKAKRGGGGKS
jgi:phosphoribosyl-ATP pyrophosphohydrolase